MKIFYVASLSKILSNTDIKDKETNMSYINLIVVEHMQFYFNMKIYKTVEIH